MTYSTIIQDIIEALPELLQNQDVIDFLHDDEDEYLRYPFYGIFSRMLIEWINNEEQDRDLLERCFAFMESMAICEDANVQTLLQVEVLETFFALPYERYIQAERQLMRPETKKLHNKNKPYFREPMPSQKTGALEYRSRQEKKATKKRSRNKGLHGRHQAE